MELTVCSQKARQLSGAGVRPDGGAAFGQRGGGDDRGLGGDPAQRRAQLPSPRGEPKTPRRRFKLSRALTFAWTGTSKLNLLTNHCWNSGFCFTKPDLSPHAHIGVLLCLRPHTCCG